MKRNIQKFGEQIDISLEGKIYGDQATLLREELFPYTEKGLCNFIFHFDNVDYIDSSGLGVLVAIQKRAIQNGGRVKIKGLKEELKDLFELTGLTKVFDIQ